MNKNELSGTCLWFWLNLDMDEQITGVQEFEQHSETLSEEQDRRHC